MSDPIFRGEVWWAILGDSVGSEPSDRRPVLIIQANVFNRSALRTVTVASLTGNLTRATAKGNVFITSRQSGLPRDSVVNISQLVTINRTALDEHIGNLPASAMVQVDEGLRLALGL